MTHDYINSQDDISAFRIFITADIFILTALITTLLALVTVGTQSFRAARKNPVEALGHK